MSGIQAIGTRAILSDGAGRGGIGQQAARRRVELTQSLGRRSESAFERVVAAGVEDDEKGAVLGVLHVAQQFPNIHRLLGHVGGAADVGAHRDNVVAPVLLQTVASIVEEAELDSGILDAPAESFHCRLQPARSRSSCLSTWNSPTGKQRGHCVGIVQRVDQRRGPVGRVADD